MHFSIGMTQHCLQYILTAVNLTGAAARWQTFANGWSNRNQPSNWLPESTTTWGWYQAFQEKPYEQHGIRRTRRLQIGRIEFRPEAPSTGEAGHTTPP
jgi:hypothetical protein